MGFLGDERPYTQRQFPAWCAFWWGMLFGGLNLLWSVGVHWGISHLAESIQRDVHDGDRTLMMLNGLGGVGKIVLGVLALATIKTWGRSIHRKLLLWALALGGAGMLLYGLANWVQEWLALAGVVDVPASVGSGPLRWYVALWEPLWMVGGILMLWTARLFQRRSTL